MNDSIHRALSILREGGLVAFPTETVYGLGADATNPDAISKIFAAKGRPATNPLIIHVADRDVARRYTTRWTDIADHLAKRFWPGPLTLILPKSPLIVDAATAGQPTVGLRAPNHPLTLELLREFDGPLAGPSANRSSHVSPTTAQHVRDDLGDRVDLVLDGGPCTVGIESTVLDLTAPRPTILRPGGLSREQIEAEIGPVELFQRAIDPAIASQSPGQHAMHYAPNTPAYRFDSQDLNHIITWCHARMDQSWAILTLGRNVELSRSFIGLPQGNDLPRLLIQMPDQPDEYARHLYRKLRDVDNQGVGAIFIEFPPDIPDWTAIRDRLTRATQPFLTK